MRAIEVNNLTKSFGNQKVLDSISFNIDKGEIVGFIGPNGAGKSTLMKCMCNLISMDSGSVKIFGKDLIKERDQALKLQSSMIEVPGLFYSFTGLQNINLFSSLYGVTKERKLEMIAYTQLGKQIQKKVSNYSLGMKQRLALAIALLNNPQFMMLDEPMNGLDPSGVIELRDELKRMVTEDDMTLLISSHQLNEIEKIADRVLYIDHGKIFNMGKSKNKTIYHFRLNRDLPDIAGLGEPLYIGPHMYQFKINDDTEFANTISMLIQNSVQILEIKQVHDELEIEYRKIYEV